MSLNEADSSSGSSNVGLENTLEGEQSTDANP
jgi:hypothetical protein